MIIIWYRDSLPSWPVCWVPTLSLWTLKVAPLHIWDNPSAFILLTSILHTEKIVFWLCVWAVSGLQQLQFGCLTWRSPGQSPQCVQINCLHCEKFCTRRAGPRDQEYGVSRECAGHKSREWRMDVSGGEYWSPKHMTAFKKKHPSWVPVLSEDEIALFAFFFFFFSFK